MNSQVHGDPHEPVKVAVVQAEPCWFDVEAATQKTCDLIAEAGANSAKLIAFPELWIPGYPNFIHAMAAKETFPYIIKYYRNSIDIESKHMESIRLAAKNAQIMCVLGISERHRGSLYMAQTFIGPHGDILLHRRKFKPTAQERILFGDASGDCITNVVSTPIGRVGGLQCFEHLQPLLKYNTYFQGEQIHVASWPNLFPPVGKMPFFNTVESCTMATHTMAVEGATFVLLASSTQTEKGLTEERPHTAVIGGGFSEIIAPDGRTLVKAPSATFEGLLYGELDFDEIYMAKSIVDTVGHYSRPDIFTLQVRGDVRRQCEYAEPGEFNHTSRFPELPTHQGPQERTGSSIATSMKAGVSSLKGVSNHKKDTVDGIVSGKRCD
ncbi:carbon-nitrogen hydrolase [Colletotrichum godetiae]|uniref:nitrilase n=1 Tax=Colletotrichum godetiae TaxID=1209918 RepID=A0AAJ0AZ70_9PEZI|nr:carbon-nitrogen hydrolase [Colletotrichum godetiae]KAK1700190.1 carbon-nitrogen hydrolase [Colletotrichum godetiae]